MKKRWITYYSLFVAIGLTSIISCGNDNNKLSRDKMVEVLHDIQLAEAVYQTRYNEFRDKENKDALVSGVLEKHGITQAQLDSSLVWYADNAEIYMRVNDSVIASLKKNVTILDENYTRGLGNLSVNNSILPSYFYLSEDLPTLTFNIDSTQISNYPQFYLAFNILGVEDKMNAELEVVFEYEDTTIISSQSLKENRYFEIKADLKPLRGVSGYFHIDADRLVNNKILLHNILLRNTEIVADSTTTLKSTEPTVAK